MKYAHRWRAKYYSAREKGIDWLTLLHATLYRARLVRRLRKDVCLVVRTNLSGVSRLAHVPRCAALCVRALCADDESPHLVFRSLPGRRCPAALLFRVFRFGRFFFLRAQPRESWKEEPATSGSLVRTTRKERRPRTGNGNVTSILRVVNIRYNQLGSI